MTVMGLPLLVSEDKKLVRIGVKNFGLVLAVQEETLTADPEDEALHYPCFKIQQLSAGGDDILDPDLNSGRHANHFQPKPVLGGHDDEGSSEHQVSLEDFANLHRVSS